MIRCVVLVILLFYVVGNNVSESNSTISNGQSNDCTQATYEGNANGACCYFPFIYGGKVYNNCTIVDWDSYWCSTTSSFDNDGMWGVCLGSEWSWSEWGTWSNCSVTCGYGNMSRTRVCLDINFCVGNTIDILSCYGTCTAGLQSSWLDWGSWSNCSSSCGIGAMNRTRVCSGGTKSCIGNNIESINCYNNRSCTGSCVQTTYGGNSNGACCYFPFVFAGRLFYNCTMYGWTAYWCGTTSNYDKDKMWGLCIGNSC